MVNRCRSAGQVLASARGVIAEGSTTEVLSERREIHTYIFICIVPIIFQPRQTLNMYTAATVDNM